jgi:hypothetical protein
MVGICQKNPLSSVMRLLVVTAMRSGVISMCRLSRFSNTHAIPRPNGMGGQICI